MQTATPITSEDVIKRYPNITAHLICQSLGYFSPMAAANAIANHINGLETCCEWYIHMYDGKRTMLEIGHDMISQAISRRRHHRGYMADYRIARAMVKTTIDDPRQSPIFQSW